MSEDEELAANNVLEACVMYFAMGESSKMTSSPMFQCSCKGQGYLDNTCAMGTS